MILCLQTTLLLIVFQCVDLKNATFPAPYKLKQLKKGDTTGSYDKLYSMVVPHDVEDFSCIEYAYGYVKLLLAGKIKPSFLADLVYSFKEFPLCEFKLNHFDAFQHDLRDFDVSEYDHMYCEINGNKICDGFTDCLTDECHCEFSNSNISEVFYCSDGLGCVTFNSLCDGHHDCIDGSDECLCEGMFVIHCPSLSEKPFCALDCVKMQMFVDDISSGDCYVEGLEGTNMLCDPKQDVLTEVHHVHYFDFYACFDDAYLQGPLSPDKLIDNDAVSKYCRHNCSNEDNPVDSWIHFCDYFLRGDQSGSSIYNMAMYVFNCDKVAYSGNTIDAGYVCNGIVDCENLADEIGCPDRFYCSNTTAEWVPYDKICDNVKDCMSGYDECQDCISGSFSSSKFLIQSNIVFILTIVGGVSILLTNVTVGVQCYRNNSSNVAGSHDRLFRLQVFVYDGLMGVYMILIFLAAVALMTEGDFCMIQEMWRSSLACSFLGIIFSVSSHGSLITIVFMSVIRCAVCHNLGEFISAGFIKIFSVFLMILNLSYAIIPLVPILEIQDIFRTEIFLVNVIDNPFIESNPLNMSRVHDIHYKAFGNKNTIYRELENLKSITSNPHLFDYLEIGYYGNTAQCVHNLFSSKKSYEVVKLTYCFIIAVLLLVLFICYVLIVRNDLRGKAELARVGRAGNPNSSSALTVKVTLMIVSQLISWVSLIVALVYYKYIKQEAAPMAAFEWLALVVIPINSLLNPIFYSDLYKRFTVLILNLWRSWSRSVQEERESKVEIEMTSVNQPQSSANLS